jgi:diguanylate cyclase (GGDEF)-like protein/PAS domain S-box-containing protein
VAADIRVSIPRLLTLIGPFIAIVCFQAVLAFVSLEVLSSVRAYIAGEGLWTKGQKDAIYFLNLYAETGEPQFYDRYKVAVAVPLADRHARHALELSPPDVDAARGGFIGGGNHVDDVDGLIWLFRNFRNISYFDRSVSQWIASDPILDELVTLGDNVHADVATSPTTRDRTAAKAEIAEINRRLTLLATAFSESLGEASRWIKLILVIANFLAAMLLIALTIWWSRYFLRQQHAYEAALRAEKERAQATLASLGESVISTDVAGRVVYMNGAAERLLRVSNETARGKALTSLFHLKCQETGVTTDIFAEDEAVAANAFQLIERADGTSVAVSIATTSLAANGTGVSNVVVIHDRTNEQEFLARLSWQASHDELTELPNRREFERRLQIAIEELATDGAGHALMFLDLDQFKVVNDTCGHAAGDQLLRQVAAVLRKHLRATDILARLGGDEFAALATDCDADRALAVAEKLRRAVEQMNFVWENRSFRVSASIGLTHIVDANTTVQEAVRTADVACYLAKEKGRNRTQLHHTSDVEFLQRVGEMDWVQKLRVALDEDQFCLDAQKIVPLADGPEAGLRVEALLRLRDRSGELVPPATFLPAAERYNLMPLIDRWVVRHAFATLARGEAVGAQRIISCAINLSGTTLSDAKFRDFLREELRTHHIRPELICFELTETSAIKDLEVAQRFIHSLREIGFRFALDDFGFGMSAFGYLRHLSVDYVKIDGGFVKGMLSDPVDRAMVEMINHIGKVTGKKTIAECAEHADIVEALREVGVDYAQGFALGAPEPFESLLPKQCGEDLAVA